MPELVFLNAKKPLVFKAAEWLAALAPGRPRDLRDCAVVLPTAGAARRLRLRLVETAEGSGLLPPRMGTPMGLLGQAVEERLATRADGLLAWVRVLTSSAAEEFSEVLAALAQREDARLRIAESLGDLCALLAEAGLTPASPEVLQACEYEEERWRQMGELYQRYRERLAQAGLKDANDAARETARKGRPIDGVRHIVVAGVPDLSLLVRTWLGNLELAGVKVTILVDAPDESHGRFDAWGRPDAESWTNLRLPLGSESIFPAADPVAEAQAAASLLAKGSGLVVADPEIAPFLERALEKLGVAVFNPEGRALAAHESAAVASLWTAFCRRGRLVDLRLLAEWPVFLQWLSRESGLAPSNVLAAIDDLRLQFLFTQLSDARRFFGDGAAGEPAAVAAAAEKLLKTHDTGKSFAAVLDFLQAVYADRPIPSDAEEAEAAEALALAALEILASPLADEGLAAELLEAAAQKTRLYARRQDDSLDLNGWLEASWLPDAALILCGCTEGALPPAVMGHAFLPDSARKKLGLQTNAERYARDIFLLHGLLASREPGAVRVTLSRSGPEGDPAKPSRLLFRCAEEELPARVRKLFDHGPSSRRHPVRQIPWPLEIPRDRPPFTSVRVTGFGAYLQCPLRFYLQQGLKMEEFDPDKREMDALDFGHVLHKTVENFSLDEEARDFTKAAAVEKYVLSQLDAVMAARYGRRLSPPVRVQKESLRARLRQFARIQAAERQAGWRITHAEFRFEKSHTLELGGLAVTASIDRVEVHEASGRRRILDYKTYASAKPPEKTHLAPLKNAPVVPEAEIAWGGKVLRWTDLQLPLYRALAKFAWPEDPEPPELAYFLLPARLEDSAIAPFPLDAPQFASAMACAEAVARNIRRGIFWPPGHVEFDAFADIFLGDDPARLFTPESLEFLKGRTA